MSETAELNVGMAFAPGHASDLWLRPPFSALSAFVTREPLVARNPPTFTSAVTTFSEETASDRLSAADERTLRNVREQEEEEEKEKGEEEEGEEEREEEEEGRASAS